MNGWSFPPIVGLLIALLAAAPAEAVDYQLDVASLWDTALYRYAKPSELKDGATGPGLEQAERSVDQGTIPDAAVLGDRTLRWGSVSAARAYGTVRVLAEISPGGTSHPRWDVVRWQGQPGERSVWLVAAAGRARPERLTRVVLQGTGPLRQFMPYIPTGGSRSAAVKYGLSFLSFYESRGTIWERYVSKTLDLSEGIGAVVGENDTKSLPDQVYLIVQHAAQPTTYKALLYWQESHYNIEAPGWVSQP